MLPHQRPKILLLGDSITEQSFSIQYHGWGAALAEWYGRTTDILNRGYSGYNSRWMRILVPKLFPEKDTSVLFATIFLGANDSSSDAQHVPLDEYRENLLLIIRHCHWINSNMKVILITPPTVNNSLWPDRNASTTALYARAVLELGHELSKENRNVHVISLWDDHELNLSEEIQIHRWWGTKDAPENLQPINMGDDLNDGLHLAIGGNEKVFQQLKGCILQNFPPSAIPVTAVSDSSSAAATDGYLQKHFPLWSELISCESESQIASHMNNWKWKS